MLFSKETKAHASNGALSASFTMIVLQPLQVVRTSIIIESSNNKKIKIHQMISRIVLTEGITGLYRGFIPGVLKSTIGSGIYFSSLETSKKYLNAHFEFSKHVKNSLAGAIGRLFQNIATNPILVIKTRSEVVGFNAYNSFFEGFAKIFKQEGLSGYYKGLKPNLIKDLPFSAIFFPLYEFFKNTLSFAGLKSFYTISTCSSILANIVCVTLTNPLEVIRTRTQFIHISQNENHNYNGVLHALNKIYHLEGIRGLLTGVYLRFMKKALQSVLVWTMYEGLKIELERKSKHSNL